MRIKRVLIVILFCAAILAIVFCISVFVSFHNMQENAKIRQIEIDSYDLKYFVTESNELYIGGGHSDWKGVYDTGFHWGFLYRVRRFFCGGTDAPVRFAQNVQSVFTGSDGFLFTDVEGTLFYFGEKAGGRLIQIAPNVTSASEYGDIIVYVTSAGEAYCMVFENETWDAPVLIADDAASVYTNGFIARIVTASGKFYQVNLFTFGKGRLNQTEAAGISTNRSLQASDSCYEENVQSMANNYNQTLVLLDSGMLVQYRWETGQEDDALWIEGILKTRQDIDDQVVAVDINDTNYSYYLCTDGGLYQFSEYPHVTKELVSLLQRTDVIDIAAGYRVVYILFSDGSYSVFSADK